MTTINEQPGIKTAGFLYPDTIESPRVHLGTYRGWEIEIGVARGEEDILSVNAYNYGTSFCRAFGRYVPCGSSLPRPSDDELKKELDGLKETIDKYELNRAPKGFDPMTYIQKW
jgi:hypothetical protein